MADVAARTVPDDHAPGLGPLVPAERPRAGAVGLDAVERVDGAVVPFDAPRGVLAVWAALDEGRDQTYRLLTLPHDGTPLELLTNACSIVAQSRLLTVDTVAAAARPVQNFGIVLRSARITNPERRECRICMQRQLTFGGGYLLGIPASEANRLSSTS